MGTSLIESLRRAIDHILGPILAGTRRVALLDFPTHANVGDSAIWLGTLAYLRKKGKVVCYSCDHDTYSRDTLAERLDDGIILLSGGGNFGDIWKQPQRLREQVVRDFPDSTIVQLPQTIMFRDESELARARAIFDAHSSLTLLVRDRRATLGGHGAPAGADHARRAAGDGTSCSTSVPRRALVSPSPRRPPRLAGRSGDD